MRFKVIKVEKDKRIMKYRDKITLVNMGTTIDSTILVK